MRIIAIILALFVAFPNMGYALVNDCCSHEEVVQSDCGDDSDTKTTQDHDNDHEPCPSQCDCACCTSAFLIKAHIDLNEKSISSFLATNPLNSGTSFAIGVYDNIWQPPQRS